MSVLVVTLVASFLIATALSANVKPHIIHILADDLGYNDLGDRKRPL